MRVSAVKRSFFWNPRPDEVSYASVNQFIRRTYYKHVFLTFVGFMVGLRISGALFFDEQRMLAVREQFEEAYWKEHGPPKNFDPEWVPCVSQEKKGQLCPTWIRTTPESERYFRKVDPAEFILEETTK